ncbi:MAG: cupin domain-containing protein [Myxococcota bacterium]
MPDTAANSAPMPGLGALLGMDDLAPFFREHWPDRHCLTHGSVERVGELGHVPELASVDTLLEAVDDEILVMPNHLPGEGYGGGVPVKSSAARALFASGLTLWIKRLDKSIPFFARLRSRFAADLGVAESDVHPQLWVSPKGKATPQHFDAAEVFVFQLRGHKRWRVAPNDEVRYPMIDSQLSRMQLRRADTQLDLQPGSFLYLPRGHWHHTEALSESWSITLFVKAPSWLRVLQEHLFRELGKDERWRKPVAVASPVEGYRRESAAELGTLLGELVHEFAPQHADAIFEAARRGVTGRSRAARERSRTRPYRRIEGSTVEVERGGSMVVVRVSSTEDTITELELSAELESIVRWIIEHEGAFSPVDLDPLLHEIAGDAFSRALYTNQYLPTLLHELYDAGLLGSDEE